MEYIRLDKLVDLKQGMAINSHSNHLISEEETDLPLLRIADMPTKSKVVFMKPETPERFIANYDDIIYTRTGQVGLVFREQYGVVHNNCFRVYPLNEKQLSRNYLYWCLKLPSTYKWANTIAAGAAQPDLPHSSFKKMKIPMFPLPTQQKIASILSAYDNLIQNYKKQIEALQTAASELYKEWFVRFRFPGYQTAKFENGIPEGWKVVLASELGEFVRGKNITAEEMQEGMIPVISAGIEPSGFHNQSNVKGVSLTISNSGANAGYLQINYSDIWAADCSYCNSAKHIYFYYELLNNMRVVLFNLQKGAAQPHVYAKDINKMKILLPSTELIETANKKIKLMHEKIYSLQQQITNLTQQRDLLLPRLMSGKIEIK